MIHPILTDKDGRTHINGDIGYLAHSGPNYFCYGFAKNAEEFWDMHCKDFTPCFNRGYSFIVEPLLKGSTINKLTRVRTNKVQNPTITFIN